MAAADGCGVGDKTILIAAREMNKLQNGGPTMFHKALVCLLGAAAIAGCHTPRPEEADPDYTLTIVTQPGNSGGSIHHPLQIQPVVYVEDNKTGKPVPDGTVVRAYSRSQMSDTNLIALMTGTGVLTNNVALTIDGYARFRDLTYSAPNETFNMIFGTDGTVDSNALASAEFRLPTPTPTAIPPLLRRYQLRPPTNAAVLFLGQTNAAPPALFAPPHDRPADTACIALLDACAAKAGVGIASFMAGGQRPKNACVELPVTLKECCGTEDALRTFVAAMWEAGVPTEGRGWRMTNGQVRARLTATFRFTGGDTPPDAPAVPFPPVKPPPTACPPAVPPAAKRPEAGGGPRNGE